MKVPIIRMPLAVALDVAAFMHRLPGQLEQAAPGTPLHDLVPAARELATQVQDAVMSGYATVTEGRQTRAGRLYLERLNQAKEGAP